MNKHILILTLVAVAVLLTVGCRRMDPVGLTSDLELVFSVGEMGTGTKGSTANTLAIPATLQTGGKFDNLLVVLATGNDEVGYTVEYFDQRDYDDPVTSGTARFRNVKNRDGENLITYHVFAFANLSLKGDFWAGKSWKVIAGNLTSINNVLSEEGGDLILNGDNTAVVASGVASLLTEVEEDKGAMLLTGRGTVTVNGNKVKVNDSESGKISLQRIFTRLTVTVQNHTGHPVIIDQLSFSAFDTDMTYLLGRQIEDGAPVIPDDPNDDDDPYYFEISPITPDPENEPDPALAWTGDKTIFTTYLFENKANEEYKMYGHVIMYTSTSPRTKENALYLGGGTAPKGNGSVLQKLVNQIPEQLIYMNRNQALDIIMYINRGSSTGDFSIQVTSDWTKNVGGTHTFQ